MEIKKLPDLDYSLHCSKCNRAVGHTFRFLSATKWDDDDLDMFGGADFYQGQCTDCKVESFLLKRTYNSEDVNTTYDAGDGEVYAEQCYRDIFFMSVDGLQFACDFNIPAGEREYIPDSVLSILSETQHAKETGSWVLWSIGIRSILEESLVRYYENNNITRKKNPDLIVEIQYFVQHIETINSNYKLLLGNFLKKIDDLRHFGNDAVHRREPVTEENRSSFAEFVVALLQVMFVWPAQFAKLQEHKPVHPKNI